MELGFTNLNEIKTPVNAGSSRLPAEGQGFPMTEAIHRHWLPGQGGKDGRNWGAPGPDGK